MRKELGQDAARTTKASADVVPTSAKLGSDVVSASYSSTYRTNCDRAQDGAEKADDAACGREHDPSIHPAPVHSKFSPHVRVQYRVQVNVSDRHESGRQEKKTPQCKRNVGTRTRSSCHTFVQLSCDGGRAAANDARHLRVIATVTKVLREPGRELWSRRSRRNLLRNTERWHSVFVWEQ